jgi:hypothetical protein
VTDVFIRTSRNANPLRAAMYELCRTRWEIDPNVRVCLLRDQPIREGRLFADEWAKSDPYIITDDDVLIVGKDWVKRGLEAMLANPEYGVCSTLSLVEGENEAKGSGVIYPMHAVGQPMWIRKGLMADLPPFDFTFECQVIQSHIEAKGFKEGIINGLRHNHIGHGFSGTPVHFWGY